MSEQTTLPESWIVIPLPIAASINPPKGKIEATESELAHFVPMACVQAEFSGIDVSTTRPLREVLKGYTYFQEGDVLFAKITPCMENGKLAVVPPLDHRWGFGSTEFHVLRASEMVLPKWIAHFVSQSSVRRDAQRSMTGTAGQLRVPALWLNEQELPIPPLAEQSRIVTEIEELFSDLDAGVAALKRAKANLKRYRASVLKSAVEGKLTEQWRAKHPAIEPASALLARILLERRQKWEADQLAKFAAAKKEPPKNWRDKYIEPLHETGRFELPESWTWASTLEICERVENGNTPPPNEMFEGDGEVPFIKVYNLTKNGSLDFSVKPTFVSQVTHETLLGRSRILPNDVLMNIVGPPLGKVSVVPSDYPEWNTNQAVVLFRASMAVLPRYLAACLMCDDVMFWITRTARATAGQSNISVGNSRILPIPIPPAREQAVIVETLDETLSQIDAAEKQIEHGLLRAARLRQSILKRAFEGKLVPQDPKDEPASALLERLRTSRTHDEANGTAATSKPNRAKIKESSGEPRTRIRRRASTRNQQEE
jgi:type I restriction enzyme S subunit